jgi:uncharacterized delta-60 repeat protein
MRNVRRTRLTAAAAIAATGALAGVATANHGALDPFFGNQGVVLGGGISIVDLPGAGSERAEDALALPGGKILAAGIAGGFTVAGYTASGRLDPTWSGDGSVTLDTGGRVNALARGNALPLLAAGTSRISAQAGKVLRVTGFKADGAVDTAFGAGGSLVVGFGAAVDGVARAIAADAPPPATPTSPALTPLVAVAGYQGTDSPAGAKQAVVVELLRDGQLAAGFDGDGKVFLPHVQGPTSIDQAEDLAFTSGRGLAVVGSSQNPGSNARSWVIKLTAQGALDTTFGGGDGIVSGSFGCSVNGTAFLNSVLVDPAGRIVAAGACSGSSAVVTRLLPDGTPDPAFSADGNVIVPGPSGATIALNDIVRQADGTLVAAGSTRSSNVTRFALMSLTDAGALNAGFGAGGFVVTTPAGSTSAVANALITVADGNLVAAGHSNAGGERFTLVKYHAKRDTKAPTGAINVLDDQVDGVVERGAFRVRLTGSEAVSGVIRIRLAGRRAVIARVTVPVAAAKRRLLRVPLTKVGRNLLDGRDSAQVVASAKIEDLSEKRATLSDTGSLD